MEVNTSVTRFSTPPAPKPRRKARAIMLEAASKLVVIAAFALTMSGFVSQAHATIFTVRLDNDLTPSHYSGAKTNAPIAVIVYFDGYTAVSDGRALDTISSTHDYTFNVPGYAITDIEAVEVFMAPVGYNDDDLDLFILDQIKLYNEFGGLVKSSGVENEIGFCLSWESSDGNNSHCQNGEVSFFRQFF
jgi:hypothetical protein